MILLPGSEYMIIGSKAIISLVSGISQKRRITNVIQRFYCDYFDMAENT